MHTLPFQTATCIKTTTEPQRQKKTNKSHPNSIILAVMGGNFETTQACKAAANSEAHAQTQLAGIANAANKAATSAKIALHLRRNSLQKFEFLQITPPGNNATRPCSHRRRGGPQIVPQELNAQQAEHDEANVYPRANPDHPLMLPMGVCTCKQHTKLIRTVKFSDRQVTRQGDLELGMCFQYESGLLAATIWGQHAKVSALLVLEQKSQATLAGGRDVRINAGSVHKIVCSGGKHKSGGLLSTLQRIRVHTLARVEVVSGVEDGSQRDIFYENPALQLPNGREWLWHQE